MAKLKIKKGDLVQVLSGKDKGLQGKVISVNTETQRVVVEGVQRVTRHTKAGFGGQAGGFGSGGPAGFPPVAHTQTSTLSGRRD